MPRPKQFDPEETLERAMHLFWRGGYKATSVQTLVDTLRLNRFSLYGTFGGKRDLFLAAMDRYRDDVVAERLQSLERAYTGLERIRRYFAGITGYLTTKDGWRGCLMTNSAVEFGRQDAAAADRIKNHLTRLEGFFYTALVQARTQGELSSGANLRDYARFLMTTAQGLGVIAKTAPDRKTLQGIVRTTLAAIR